MMPRTLARAVALAFLMTSHAACPTAGVREFHVYIYSRTFEEYRGRFNTLAHDLQAFGFTDIYLSVKTKKIGEEISYIRDFRLCNVALHAKGLKIHALILQGPAAYLRPPTQHDEIQLILDFNSACGRNERFDGITFDLEPHTLKEKYGIPNDFPAWNPVNGYGIGGPNDQLMQRTLAILKKARETIRPAGLLLSEAVGHFFHDRVSDGDLRWGNVNDFLAYVDFVVIMDYADDIRLLRKFVREEIESARKHRSIVICLKTRSNPVPGRDGRGAETTFHEEGWAKLQGAIAELEKEFRRFPSFRGIGIFEYDSYRSMAGGKR